jgi:hypothetical protein
MASEGNSSEGTVESISVVIRIRPLNTRERGEDLALDIDEENSRIEAIEKDKKSNVGAAENNRANPSWKFDRVFGLNTQQGKFYDDVARSRVATTFDGFNATIFAYGQVEFYVWLFIFLDSWSHLCIFFLDWFWQNIHYGRCLGQSWYHSTSNFSNL